MATDILSIAIDAWLDPDTPPHLRSRLGEFLQGERSSPLWTSALERLEDDHPENTALPPDLKSKIRSAVILRRVQGLMLELARRLPRRTSLRQSLALVMVALAELQEREVTVASLQRAGGVDANKEPIFGAGLARSHISLLEEGLVSSRAKASPTDDRARPLTLTPAGRDLISDAISEVS